MVRSRAHSSSLDFQNKTKTFSREGFGCEPGRGGLFFWAGGYIKPVAGVRREETELHLLHGIKHAVVSAAELRPAPRRTHRSGTERSGPDSLRLYR